MAAQPPLAKLASAASVQLQPCVRKSTLMTFVRCAKSLKSVAELIPYVGETVSAFVTLLEPAAKCLPLLCGLERTVFTVEDTSSDERQMALLLVDGRDAWERAFPACCPSRFFVLAEGGKTHTLTQERPWPRLQRPKVLCMEGEEDCLTCAAVASIQEHRGQDTRLVAASEQVLCAVPACGCDYGSCFCVPCRAAQFLCFRCVSCADGRQPVPLQRLQQPCSFELQAPVPTVMVVDEDFELGEKFPRPSAANGLPLPGDRRSLTVQRPYGCFAGCLDDRLNTLRPLGQGQLELLPMGCWGRLSRRLRCEELCQQGVLEGDLMGMAPELLSEIMAGAEVLAVGLERFQAMQRVARSLAEKVQEELFGEVEGSLAQAGGAYLRAFGERLAVRERNAGKRDAEALKAAHFSGLQAALKGRRLSETVDMDAVAAEALKESCAECVRSFSELSLRPLIREQCDGLPEEVREVLALHSASLVERAALCIVLALLEAAQATAASAHGDLQWQAVAKNVDQAKLAAALCHSLEDEAQQIARDVLFAEELVEARNELESATETEVLKSIRRVGFPTVCIFKEEEKPDGFSGLQKLMAVTWAINNIYAPGSSNSTD